MTKEDFIKLQSDHVKSGMSLKLYLQQIGTSYSTYNYWRKKYSLSGEQCREIAPISFLGSGTSQCPLPPDVPSGVSLLFPNGLRAHFGAGADGMLRELLYKSLDCDVLP